ncbi:iron-hydroxamate ABC transporter substrate-binding protein [Radiobacillus kanasensis]|uniref:iron-hydroxamate ABC transporter substrate-binding protein n=1 Tax=Radiobacillus kanasensis TaxID=2844358 RepID=UPI001E57B8D5|nr:iron-hydroxamate ABC transporter substrate-binding protein [Radiobacillus kanasensis]UFU00821.1 iron-hydroxamate ABC transporter substrate-binding protein [Radiobacillus kanasensis]
MKKIYIPLFLMLLLLISACGNSEEASSSTNNQDQEPETITYDSENGPIEVPTNPQRVVVLSSFAGNVMALDVPLVGVDSWSKMNPRYEELKDVEEVTDENIEKILELNPDLIIGLSTIKNVEKLQEIAPTVTYTYGKLDYLEQHIEIGKLLNKEEEAKAWVEDFKQRAQVLGEDIKQKIGEDATVSVIENDDKNLYVFGDNWGRGTEILYQEMGLKMPEKVKEMALEPGYYTLSSEALPEFAGDYMIFSKVSDGYTSFQETETYQNIPAVQKGQVFEVDAKWFYFNDPLTLEDQLTYFVDVFLSK